MSRVLNIILGIALLASCFFHCRQCKETNSLESKNAVIDSSLIQAQNALWRAKSRIDNLQLGRDSLLNRLRDAIHQHGSDSTVIAALNQQITVANAQIAQMKSDFSANIDPRYREYYENQIAVEKGKLEIAEQRAATYKSQLDEAWAFNQKLVSDLNAIQTYVDRVANVKIEDFTSFDPSTNQRTVPQDVSSKVSELRNQLDQSRQLLEQYAKDYEWARKMKDQIQGYQDRINSLERQLNEVKNAVWVAVGTKDELIKSGILRVVKKVFRKDEIVSDFTRVGEGKPYCIKLDKRNNEFEINAASSKIIMYPARPNTSYPPSGGSDPSKKKIRLIDTNGFWKNNALIIQVGD